MDHLYSRYRSIASNGVNNNRANHWDSSHMNIPIAGPIAQKCQHRKSISQQTSYLTIHPSPFNHSLCQCSSSASVHKWGLPASYKLLITKLASMSPSTPSLVGGRREPRVHRVEWHQAQRVARATKQIPQITKKSWQSSRPIAHTGVRTKRNCTKRSTWKKGASQGPDMARSRRLARCLKNTWSQMSQEDDL